MCSWHQYSRWPSRGAKIISLPSSPFFSSCSFHFQPELPVTRFLLGLRFSLFFSDSFFSPIIHLFFKMQIFGTTLILSALSALAFANPTPGFGSSKSTTSSSSSGTTCPAALWGYDPCLTAGSASCLVDGFASLLTAYTNATANSLLANSFTDTSDSINFLGGYPLGSTTFPSKTAFELGQGSQPAIGFKVLNIDAVTCNVIAFRWEAILGTSSPVKGIDILYAANNGGNWQITSVFSEFNSATWVQEIGGTCTTPSRPATS